MPIGFIFNVQSMDVPGTIQTQDDGPSAGARMLLSRYRVGRSYVTVACSLDQVR